MGWSVFTKRGLGARLSCSEEDFATEKCRSIDRLAEKGFCNKSSNKPSLLNRKQFTLSSSYILDTNWPFKWSLRKILTVFNYSLFQANQSLQCITTAVLSQKKCLFVIVKKNVRKCSCDIAWVNYLYFYRVQTFNDHFDMCSRDMLSHKRIIRTRIIIFCALVLLQNVFWCEL